MSNSERFWDRTAKRSKQGKTLSSSAQKTVDATIPYLKTSQNLLDFACGTGAMTLELSKLVENTIGIDTSEGMIAVAKERSKGINNLTFQRTTIDHESLQPSSFDIITAFNILHLADDKEAIVSRIHELLKPGGLFISATACIGEKASFLKGMLSILQFLRLVPNINYVTKTELESLIQNRGFDLIETTKISDLPEYFIISKPSI